MTSTLEWLKSQPHEGKFETVSDALNYQHAISILGSEEYLLYLHWVIEQKQAEIEKLRAEPKGKRETVELSGRIEYDFQGKPRFFSHPMDNQTHRITFDLIDGETTDPASIKIEALE